MSDFDISDSCVFMDSVHDSDMKEKYTELNNHVMPDMEDMEECTINNRVMKYTKYRRLLRDIDSKRTDFDKIACNLTESSENIKSIESRRRGIAEEILSIIMRLEHIKSREINKLNTGLIAETRNAILICKEKKTLISQLIELEKRKSEFGDMNSDKEFIVELMGLNHAQMHEPVHHETNSEPDPEPTPEDIKVQLASIVETDVQPQQMDMAKEYDIITDLANAFRNNDEEYDDPIPSTGSRKRKRTQKESR